MLTISRNLLGHDIKEAIRQLRFGLAQNANAMTVYNNGTAPYLPNAGQGNTYYEYDVGQGRFNRGRARIVGLFAANGALLAMYFTSTHYASWREII